MISASQHTLRRSLSRNTHIINGGVVSRFLSSSSSLIPERSLWDTIYSGTKGMISLVTSEESRRQFMDVVQGSTINAEVLKRARMGNMLTIALFHDLQDPLFQKHSFNASDFLTGVQPALSNFHDTLGQLQNEFPVVTNPEERTEKLLNRMQQIVTSSMNPAQNPDGGLTMADNNPWKEQAKKDPESPAAKLSQMVSPKLLDSLFLTTETSSMLARYKEGSTKVSYVALLSARAMVMDEEEFPNDDIVGNEEETDKPKVDENDTGVSKMESTATAATTEAEKNGTTAHDSKDELTENKTKMEESSNETATKDSSSDKMPEGEEATMSATATENRESQQETMALDTTPVAAQIEVLYEMNQTIEVRTDVFGGEASESNKKNDDNESKESSNKEDVKPVAKDETQIWVGTFEGWLSGGPDGGLIWRITHMRPPHAEFPELYGRY